MSEYDNYLSDIDRFLIAFDEEYPDKSLSQKKEIEKYQRIIRLRDAARLPKQDAKKSNSQSILTSG